MNMSKMKLGGVGPFISLAIYLCLSPISSYHRSAHKEGLSKKDSQKKNSLKKDFQRRIHKEGFAKKDSQSRIFKESLAKKGLG